MKNKAYLYSILGICAIIAALFYCNYKAPGDRFSNIWPRWLISGIVIIIIVTLFIYWAIKIIPIKTRNLSGVDISQLKNDMYEALAEYSAEIDLHGSICKIVAMKEDKRIEVEWVIDVKEVYFDFYESGGKIFTDWGDYFYADKPAEIRDEIIDVILGFLRFPTRVIKYKAYRFFPTTTELQVFANGEWKDVYSMKRPEITDSEFT